MATLCTNRRFRTSLAPSLARGKIVLIYIQSTAKSTSSAGSGSSGNSGAPGFNGQVSPKQTWAFGRVSKVDQTICVPQVFASKKLTLGFLSWSFEEKNHWPHWLAKSQVFQPKTRPSNAGSYQIQQHKTGANVCWPRHMGKAAKIVVCRFPEQPLIGPGPGKQSKAGLSNN